MYSSESNSKSKVAMRRDISNARDGWRDDWLRHGWCDSFSVYPQPSSSYSSSSSSSSSSFSSSRNGCRRGSALRTEIEPCSVRALRVVTMCYRHLLQFLSLKLNSFFGRTARRRRDSMLASLTSLRMFHSHLATFLVFSALAAVTEACSSRNTPKPRPPPPSARPNVTFPTYTCPPAYAAWYCLNGATCFTVKIEDSLLYNCECAEGYMGQRCEFKDLAGTYLPSRQRVLLETASIAGGATIAVFLVVIVCVTLYLHYQRISKQRRIASEDRPDGYSQRPRPFSRSLSIPMERLDERHKEQAVKAKSQLTELKTDSTAYRVPP